MLRSGGDTRRSGRVRSILKEFVEPWDAPDMSKHFADVPPPAPGVPFKLQAGQVAESFPQLSLPSTATPNSAEPSPQTQLRTQGIYFVPSNGVWGTVVYDAPRTADKLPSAAETDSLAKPSPTAEAEGESRTEVSSVDGILTASSTVQAIAPYLHVGDRASGGAVTPSSNSLSRSTTLLVSTLQSCHLVTTDIRRQP